MKKVLQTVTALILFGCIFMLSACSDFAFNPLGQWEYTSCLINGEESIDTIMNMYKDLYNASSFRLVFEKNGTAYFALDDEKLEERTTYTYDYDDEKVNIYVYDTLAGEVAFVQNYIVSEDKQTITWTETDIYDNVIVHIYTRIS